MKEYRSIGETPEITLDRKGVPERTNTATPGRVMVPERTHKDTPMTSPERDTVATMAPEAVPPRTAPERAKVAMIEKPAPGRI